MISKKRFVIDTNALIFYFNSVFQQANKLSKLANNIITNGFINNSDTLLIVPSVVFLEIYKKWCITEEDSKKIYYEVYRKVSQSENIEIKPIEKEVLENLVRIGGILDNHDINDKIILACAIMLECPLISTDDKVLEYVNESKIIPMVIY